MAINGSQVNAVASNASPDEAWRFDDGILQSSTYSWMNDDALALDIIAAGRHVAELALDALRRFAALRFAGTAPARLLPHIGLDRSILRYYAESFDAYRRRLQAHREWHQKRGLRMGPYSIMRHFGVGCAGVHSIAAPVALWGVYSIDSVKFYEAGCEGLLWCLRADDADGARYLYWDGSSWQEFASAPDATDISAQGQSADALEALSAAQWSELLPCGDLSFITYLNRDNFERHLGLLVDTAATFI